MTKLSDLLAGLTVKKLKSLLALTPEAPRVSKKGELVESILQGFVGEGLRALWNRLDDLQRLAVAETAYNPGGYFDGFKFEAKYGPSSDVLARQLRNSASGGSPALLHLFLYYEDRQYRLADDIAARLKDFVAEPEPVRLNTVATLPERVDGELLTVRHTERDAIVDLSVLLRLADQGKIQVSDKTALPSGETLRLLTGKLAGGDFYVPEPKRDRFDQEIGPIKAFAWPVLLQSAGFVTRTGGKLALSRAGIKALSAAPAEGLCTLWRRWLKSGLLDEFSRVDAIKGQRSKGRVMTAVAPRRAAIDVALQSCPAGAWIEVNELSRFMRASDYVFEVAYDPWKLYITDPQYGSLGYDGSSDWDILQLRYLLCVLFEYAATLGIIDVAYTKPDAVRQDYGHMWGTDDLGFLSRYDGLIYVRLTPLGAYCLGHSAQYASAAVRSSVKLSVLPSLQVKLVAGELAPDEALVLDTWAAQTSIATWQLDRQKTLGAIEKGHDVAELTEFLQTRDDQPLPDTVESFIKESNRRGQALKVAGTVLLIECHDTETADAVSTHKETAGLCLRAGERQLVVRLEHEEKFRSRIRILGFGMKA